MAILFIAALAMGGVAEARSHEGKDKSAHTALEIFMRHNRKHIAAAKADEARHDADSKAEAGGKDETGDSAPKGGERRHRR